MAFPLYLYGPGDTYRIVGQGIDPVADEAELAKGLADGFWEWKRPPASQSSVTPAVEPVAPVETPEPLAPVIPKRRGRPPKAKELV